ncbi:hypothetical protein AA313_de0210086 [Arthrobotrys entomopaga]|nr:hypothetical protein AA313_de0210086 [Arthrobotrys entomopaga]
MSTKYTASLNLKLTWSVSFFEFLPPLLSQQALVEDTHTHTHTQRYFGTLGAFRGFFLSFWVGFDSGAPLCVQSSSGRRHRPIKSRRGKPPVNTNRKEKIKNKNK